MSKKLIPKCLTAWTPIYRTNVNPSEEDKNQEILLALTRATEGYRKGEIDEKQQQKDKRRQAFTNAMLAGAMAEDPEMMIASGWRQNEDGNFVLDLIDDPGVKALRNNLVGIGIVGAAPIITAATPALLPTAGEIAADWAITKPLLTKAGKEMAFSLGTATVGDAFHVARTGKTWELDGADRYLTWMPDGIFKDITSGFFNPFGYYTLGLGQYVTNAVSNSIDNVARFRRKSLIGRKLMTTLDDGTPIVEAMPLNVGWGPAQTISVKHASNSADPLVLYNPKRWDVVNEGANPHGIWYLGEWGVPRTIANATKEKAEKAARARAIFEERPYAHEGELVLKKPIITVGEVPDRSILSYQADALGADGLIYNDVYDNGYNNNQVILSFKHHNPQALVKWYGPTMGKTTAAKTNANLVDIDPLLKPIRAKHAERLGLLISDPRVSANPEYKQEVADFVLEWRLKPENKGKTLIASTKHLLDPTYNIPFDNNPVIPDLETFIARNKARGFRESEEELRNWYNSIFLQNNNIKIDNRFVSDIEPKAINSSVKFNTGLYTDFNQTTLIGDRWYDFSKLDPKHRQYIENALNNTGFVDTSNLPDEVITQLGLTPQRGFPNKLLLNLYLNPQLDDEAYLNLIKLLSEANYRAFIRAFSIPEKEYIDPEPLLRHVPGFAPSPFVYQTVEYDTPIDILGEMNSSDLDRFWGEEIIERLKSRSLDPEDVNTLQDVFLKNQIETTTPSFEIMNAVDQPITVYKSLTPVDFDGFYNGNTGRSFVDILNLKDPSLQSIRHHETIKHGTDDIVNHYFTNDDYEAFFRLIDTSNFGNKDSIKPEELRATLGEILERNVRTQMKETTREEFKRSLSSYLQMLDGLDNFELLNYLKSELNKTNGYGQDYAYALTVSGAKYLRELLKYAPIITGLITSPEIQKQKQGGRLIPKHATGSLVNNNPLPKYLINDNPVPSKKEDKKKKKLFEIDLRVIGVRPAPGFLTFPRGDSNGLYMIKRNE